MAAKSWPIARARRSASGPRCRLPAGYASTWWTQKRNGSTVGHGGAPRRKVCRIRSAMDPGYEDDRRRRRRRALVVQRGTIAAADGGEQIAASLETSSERRADCLSQLSGATERW